MDRLQISLKGLMIGLVVLSAAMGVVVSQSSFAANLLTTIAMAGLVLATVGALATQGNRRVFWSPTRTPPTGKSSSAGTTEALTNGLSETTSETTPRPFGRPPIACSGCA